MNNGEYNSCSEWIDAQEMRGRYFFTKEDVQKIFPDAKGHSLEVALSRLVSSKRIMSPWKNFYVIVSMEYRLRGVVPEHFYIDQLMRFLSRNYYVSLLSAAALHGASHQQSMTYFVMADGAPLRNVRKKGTKIDFIQKNDIASDCLQQEKTQSGYLNVSSPLMTALDLVQQERKVGGMSRVAEVLYELMDVVTLDDKSLPLLRRFPVAVIQRLGYILSLLEYEPVADELYALCRNGGLKFRKTALKASAPVEEGMPVDERWKVIVNKEIDIDEI
ncbi:MAG: type IV toxin-antitoxin system AbiEi family antitoxin [Bacteroidales bacterium]|nr:type IV toxin-antitoxin system AbiEi family antitoxin [Bacteroidales bacterium]